MAKRKSKSSSPQYSYYMAIVAIVAVVAIVILVMNSMQTQVEESLSDISDEETLAGKSYSTVKGTVTCNSNSDCSSNKICRKRKNINNGMIMNDPYKKCYSRLNDGDQCEYGQCSEGLACMLSGTIFKCQKRLKENVKCNTDEHCMEGLICRQGQIKNKWVSGSKKCRKLLWSGASCNYDKQCKKGSCVEGICKVGSCDDGQSWKPECKKNACLDKETNTFVFGKVKKSNSWLQVYYFTKKANECAKLIIQKHQAQTCDDWNNQCIVCRN